VGASGAATPGDSVQGAAKLAGIYIKKTFNSLRLTNFKLLNQKQANSTNNSDIFKVHNICKRQPF
jgi:hypothetical protein